MSAPTSIVLFTYRVGFGDCFLLRFGYPSGDRHVLVDFGSTAPASDRVGSQLTDVATDLAARCKGKLDAIVATHRHADHISGFAGDPWKLVAALKPELVLLPWTEDPDAAPDARRATRRRAPGLGLQSARHVAALSAMQEVARATLDEVREKGDAVALRGRRGGARTAAPEEAPDEAQDWIPTSRPFSRALTKQLAFLGEENLANAAAVKNLMTLPREFLAFGQSTRLERLLPGVKVRVLGPPTLEQSASIARQRQVDPDEFWHVSARALARSTRSGAPLFPRMKPVPVGRQPVEVRWFMRRMDGVRGEELLELVRILDAAMNNTSLVLLFEACGKKLLFPGDAQIESWSYALSKPEIRALLADVDVYKVGHHGSLNATPKTLWELFRKRGPKRRLETFLSTRPGKHGSSQRGTEVPRAKLVARLRQESTLHSTTDLHGKDELVIETRIA
jgi:hypothetical protein